MPSFKMKTKSCTGCLKDKSGLRVCQTSIIVSKNSCSHLKIFRQTAELDTSLEFFQDVSSTNKASIQNIGNDEAIDHSESLDGENPQLQRQPSSLVDSLATERMESTPTTCQSSIETIFSPILDSAELHSELTVDSDGGIHNDIDVPKLGADDSDNNRSLHDCQTCNVTDFYISDMIIAGLPFDGNTVYEDITETNPFLDYQCPESNMFFDVDEEYTILPFLEDTVDTRKPKSGEENLADSNDSSLYLAIHQMKPCNQDYNIAPYSDLNASSECFDPHMFIRNLPELADAPLLPKESRKRRSITLVLDLDETLVHSTLEPSDDAHFTFPVFFNMKLHTVYVKQRPFLEAFLERVSEMFEIILFTASQSVYAAQLLDILDPHGNIFSRRAYRESCIFADGSYTKDLTVLGVDLAKVAIIDNSPQVFRLQVNNGIPIKSWFDDPSDHALLSLLPFLETLVDVDDVRPIIAKRYGNNE